MVKGVHVYEYTTKQFVTSIINNKAIPILVRLAWERHGVAHEELDKGQISLEACQDAGKLLTFLGENRIDPIDPKKHFNTGWTLSIRVNKIGKTQEQIDAIRNSFTSILQPFIGDYTNPKSVPRNKLIFIYGTEGTVFGGALGKLSPESAVMAFTQAPEQDQLGKVLTILQKSGYISSELQEVILKANAEKLNITYEKKEYQIVDKHIDDMKKNLKEICDAMEAKMGNKVAKLANGIVVSLLSTNIFANFKVDTDLKELIKNPDISSIDFLQEVIKLEKKAIKYGNYKDNLQNFIKKYEHILNDDNAYGVTTISSLQN